MRPPVVRLALVQGKRPAIPRVNQFSPGPCATRLLTARHDQTSSRPRNEIPGDLSSRRGHASQLSISDPSHHVTEAIGTLYGDEDDSGSEAGRPLRFIGGYSYSEQLQRSLPLSEPPEHQEPRQYSDEASRQPSVLDSPGSPTEHGSPKKAHTIFIPPPRSGVVALKSRVPSRLAPRPCPCATSRQIRLARNFP